MTWFKYMDTYSGGSQKTEWDTIIVEADSHEEADARFTERTDEDPNNETCDCCGEDFYVTEGASLEAVTLHDRKSGDGHIPLDVYTARPTVLVLPKASS
jgi:hypothetical protein